MDLMNDKNKSINMNMSYTLTSSSNTKIVFYEELDKINFKEEFIFLEKYKNAKILILTEEKLRNKFEQGYLKEMKKSFPLQYEYFFIEEGDFFKTQDIVDKVIYFMFEKSFDRSSCIIGLGGGKITDLAGYIASIFLRGVDNILMPTNLLSMVDACVGGKTAINDLKFGKNLIGTIYQPKYIIMNLWMLIDLEDDLISDGMSEIIKIFSMFDEELFYALSRFSLQSIRTETNRLFLNSVVMKAVQLKVDVISKDTTDKGIRNVLNFGHTIGHAVESVEALNISHGKAVAIGLVAELEIAVSLGITNENTYREMKDILENYKLPTEIPKYLNPFLLIDKMKNDKKNSGNKLKIVIIKKIGQLHENLTKSLDFDFVKNFISRSVFIERVYPKSKNVNKVIKLRGSKSICNRALIISALGKGEILLQNFLFSEDTIVMVKCLRSLGVVIESIDDSTLKVVGKDGKFENINTTLKVENAGTAARFLISVCANCKNSEITIDGNERMRERPIEDLLESLTNYSSIKIEFLEEKNKFPFKIITGGQTFEGGEIKIKSRKSSQYVTSLLLSSPFFKEDSIIQLFDIEDNEKPVSYQYIEMTINMMKLWGVDVTKKGYNKYFIKKSNYSNPSNYMIEPDASTANYYLSFVALHGGEIVIDGIGQNSIQGDSKFCYFLNKISPENFRFTQTETSTTFSSSTRSDKDNQILFDEDLSIITDSFLALGVVCSQIPGMYTFRGLANQAVKESNRLELIAVNLNKLGVFCFVLPNGDGIEIHSTRDRVRRNNINFVEIDTANDHRIAMSFAVLGSCLENTKLLIDNKNCVNKTYPEFWRDFENNFGLKYSAEYFDTSKSIFRLYNENYRNSPVFLIGMRSCGKSRFGKYAAEKLELNFIDFDLLLLERNCEYKSIGEIVSSKGWEYFRKLERNLFYEIFCNEDYKYQGSIIACGGGIVENQELLQCLKSYGLVIFIDTHIDNIKSFLKPNLEEEKSCNRPQYTQDIDSVYKQRVPKYKYCSKYTFRTPYIREEELNREDFYSTTVPKIYEMFKEFIFTTCSPMKYPLPADPSFFMSIVIEENNFEKLLADISKLSVEDAECYNAIEFRADKLVNYYLENNLSKEEIVSKLVDKIAQLKFRFPSPFIPIIFTIRSSQEGGYFDKEKHKSSLYQYINKEMTNYGIEFFDLEFDYNNIEFIEDFYKRSRIIGNYRVILSKHYVTDNYNMSSMKKDIYTMSLLSHDVAKIITHCDNSSHYEEIKNFIYSHISKPLLHFQLGENNKITRILNTFLSPVYDERICLPTGKGQLSFTQMQTLRNLSGFNKKFEDRFYCVLGNPVTISPSPLIYQTAYQCYYPEGNLPFRFERKNLNSNEEFLNFILNEHKAAICSITIPFKEVLFDSNLDDRLTISEEASFINSINLIKKINNPPKIIACNTDWIANYEIIILTLSKLKKDLSNINILILGAGGASVAVILSFIMINFKKESIYIKNRTVSKTGGLIKKFGINLYKKDVVFDIVVSSVPKDSDLSFLMELVDNKNITKDTYCLDLAYTKGEGVETHFRTITSKITDHYISGLDFLLHQSFYSYEVFSGKLAPRQLLEKTLYLKHNEV